jgi:hypothetical protein
VEYVEAKTCDATFNLYVIPSSTDIYSKVNITTCGGIFRRHPNNNNNNNNSYCYKKLFSIYKVLL